MTVSGGIKNFEKGAWKKMLSATWPFIVYQHNELYIVYTEIDRVTEKSSEANRGGGPTATPLQFSTGDCDFVYTIGYHF